MRQISNMITTSCSTRTFILLPMEFVFTEWSFVSRQMQSLKVAQTLCGALAAVRQKPHWIIRINDKMQVWECKLIFPTDTLQQYIRDN